MAETSDIRIGRGRHRDRRGRGMRGPAVLPGVAGRPELRTRRERFDDVVVAVVTSLEERWREHLGLIEYAVEETPQVPDDWDADRVPLGSLVRGSGAAPHRIVVFRRPIEHRAPTLGELDRLVLRVVVEQVADLLGLDPVEVDPRAVEDDEE